MVALSAALTLLCAAAPQKGAVATVGTSPPVIVLQTAVNAETARREQRLFEQLGLVLDDFSVMMTPPPVSDFGRHTLPDQIAEVIPDAQKEGAVAVIWLNIPAPEQIMLNLVAIGTGRTLVRTVEVAKGPNAERTLAMMLRELLGTAYLFETTHGLSPAIRKVVDQVSAQVSPPPVAHATPPVPPQVAPTVTSAVSVGAQLFTTSGIAGQLGDSLRPGLEPSADYKVNDSKQGAFLVGAQAQLLLGPWSPAPAHLSGVELGVGLHASYLVPMGRALVGPTVGADLDWVHANAGDSSTELTRYFLRAGALARLVLAEGLELAASLTLLGTPTRYELRALTDMGPQVIYREGTLQVRVGAGVNFPL